MASRRQAKLASNAAIDNKVSLRQADEIRVVSSWLAQSIKSTSIPAKNKTQPTITATTGALTTTDHVSSNGNTPTNTTADHPVAPNEDEDSFTFGDDTAGLAFPVPLTISAISTVPPRQHASGNDKLRAQLMGHAAAKKFKLNQGANAASKPMPGQRGGFKPQNDGGDGSDEDDEGRTGITARGERGGVKQRKKESGSEVKSADETRNAGDKDTGTESHGAVVPVTRVTAPSSAPAKKRPASYMDELLAKRNKKKK